MPSYLKVLAVGVPGIAAICCAVSWAELVTAHIQIGFLQLPPIVLAMLFALVLANAAARRLGRLGLNSQEMAVIYTMWLLAAMVSSRGLMERLLPMLVGVNYLADDTNRWQQFFFPHVRPWLVPWHPAGEAKQAVATWFYEGLPRGEAIPWLSWLMPLAAWAVIVGAIFTAFLCLSVIMRRQWADNERLTFPLVRLPLEMIRGETGFFANRLTWVGFAIPTVVYGINGLHQSFPSLPAITLDFDLNRFLAVYPWDGVSFLHAYVSFAALGFFYLLPTDLLLSFWLFFLLAKGSDALLTAHGVPVEGMPHAAARLHTGYQTVGAFLVLSSYLVYISWPHLRRVAASVLRGPGQEDRGELLTYRTACLGLAASVLLAVVWCHLAGMSWWLAAVELLIFLFVQAVVMARCTAEGGLLMTEGSFTPRDVLALGYPLAALGPANLTALAFMDGVFTRDLRGLVLTGFLDAQKLGDEVGLQRRRLLLAIPVGLVVATVLAGAFQLYLPYAHGALGMHGFPYRQNAVQFWTENLPYLQGADSFKWGAVGWCALGAAVTVFLGFMRMRFFWWPLHPLGYAMTASWATICFWFPIFIAWLLKVVTVHYGGMKLYGRARPLFLGLIFGELTAAVCWTALSAIWNLPVPQFPWP